MSRGALLFALLWAIVFSSCNSKDETTDEQEYITTQSVAITGFSLQPDVRVMANLDSVFFSIDLEHGVVFNADSLPKGTNITKLVPKISYPSSVTSAVIEMKGGTHREDGTVNYYANANDTIDFTAHVTLTLGTENKAVTKTYVLKVNVHKEDPDVMYWDNLASMNLPSRLDSPKAQKSVEFGSGVLSLIEESDGSFTVATTTDIFAGDWQKNELKPGFTPELNTLTSTPSGTLYMLSDAGELMTSANGLSWQKADTGWSGLIGMYGDTLLGIRGSGMGRTMTCWPSGNLDGISLPDDFPASGYSAPVSFTNRWTTSPTIVVFGGDNLASGHSPSWAFDGSQWVDIADSPLPALEGLTVVDYYSYLNSASSGLLKEFEAFLAFGGRDRDGNVNNTVYVTYDHGVNWQRAQDYMQLPGNVLAGYRADAISLGTLMQSNLSNRWKAADGKRRLDFSIEGDVISWDCPYIFLFGGYDASMELDSEVRSGVLKRLTFVPLF